MFVVDFNEENARNFNDYACDVENPEIQNISTPKLLPDMQTMIDDEPTSS